LFKTGDIGAIDQTVPAHTDRKKESSRLRAGKYIVAATNRAVNQSSRFGTQVVLIGNGRKFPAALIAPDWEQISLCQLKASRQFS